MYPNNFNIPYNMGYQMPYAMGIGSRIPPWAGAMGGAPRMAGMARMGANTARGAGLLVDLVVEWAQLKPSIGEVF